MKLPSLVTKILSAYFRWAAAALAVIIMAGGYWFLLRPQIADIQSGSLAQRSRTEAQLVSEKAYLQSLQASIDKFHQVFPADKRQSIDSFLPTGADFPGLLLTIRDIAQQANVELNGLSLSASGGPADSTAPTPTSSSGVQSEDASVTFSGGTSYDSFKQFLSLIESSQRLLDVVSLSFSLGGEQGASTYTMVLRTYYLPKPS